MAKMGHASSPQIYHDDRRHMPVMEWRRGEIRSLQEATRRAACVSPPAGPSPQHPPLSTAPPAEPASDSATSSSSATSTRHGWELRAACTAGPAPCLSPSGLSRGVSAPTLKSQGAQPSEVDVPALNTSAQGPGPPAPLCAQEALHDWRATVLTCARGRTAASVTECGSLLSHTKPTPRGGGMIPGRNGSFGSLLEKTRAHALWRSV